jgi:hypothetical protein
MFTLKKANYLLLSNTEYFHPNTWTLLGSRFSSVNSQKCCGKGELSDITAGISLYLLPATEIF